MHATHRALERDVRHELVVPPGEGPRAELPGEAQVVLQTVQQQVALARGRIDHAALPPLPHL